MAATSGPVDAAEWPRDELRRLVEAWEEVVEPPRDREKLSAPELMRLHSRFEELGGRRGVRWLGSMERQRLRLVATLKRVRELDRRDGSPGRRTWLQLPEAEREALLAADGDAVVATIDQDTFRAIERICREEPPSTDAVTGTGIVNTEATEANGGGNVGSEPGPSARTTERQPGSDSHPSVAAATFTDGINRNAQDVESEASRRRNQGRERRASGAQAQADRSGRDIADVAETLAGLPIVRVSLSDPTPSPFPPTRGRELVRGEGEFYRGSPSMRWRLQDELELIRAWYHALIQRVHANQPCSSLDTLVLEEYTAVCGPNEETVSSIGAKRDKILSDFESLREYLQSRQSDAPKWFKMTVSERLAEQQSNGYHHGFACTLEGPEFDQLSSIVENERRLDLINRSEPWATADDTEHRRDSADAFQSARDPVNADGSSDPRGHRSTTDSHDRSPTRYRSAGDIADSAVLVSLRNGAKRRRMGRSSTQRGDDEETRPEHGGLTQKARAGRHTPSSSLDAPSLNLVDQLVQAQTRRLELLLEEFREERRQERQQTQELLLLLLSRVDAVPRGDVTALKALVEQQRQQLEQLFELVETEREAEWGRAQELLSELEGGRRGRR